jgi:hypothetical protein
LIEDTSLGCNTFCNTNTPNTSQRQTKVTSIRIDAEVFIEAKSINLSLSKWAEYGIKAGIEGMRTNGSANALKSGHAKLNSRRVGGRLSGESLRKLCPSNRLVDP